jgi:hypothetical protein
MRHALLFGTVLLLTAGAAARADEYKAITDAQAHQQWHASALSMDEFLLESKSLVGKTVQVRGAGFCLSETACFLRDPLNPMNRVAIEPSSLSHAELVRLMRCHALDLTCEATVQAHVTANSFGELRLVGVKAKW